MSYGKDLLVLESRPESPDEVLMYYDGPQLMWLDSIDGRQFLAAALDEEAGPWAFILAELPDAVRTRLESARLTLRQAFKAPGVRCFLMEDYGAADLEIEELDSVPEEWLPGDEYLDA